MNNWTYVINTSAAHLKWNVRQLEPKRPFLFFSSGDWCVHVNTFSILPRPSSASSGGHFLNKLLYKPSRGPPEAALGPKKWQNDAKQLWRLAKTHFLSPPRPSGPSHGPPRAPETVLRPQKWAKWCKTAMTSCKNSLFGVIQNRDRQTHRQTYGRPYRNILAESI